MLAHTVERPLLGRLEHLKRHGHPTERLEESIVRTPPNKGPQDRPCRVGTHSTSKTTMLFQEPEKTTVTTTAVAI